VWGVWWVWWVWGGFPLRSNIPRSALCATLDTYNFKFSSILLRVTIFVVLKKHY
jgi:hypothetical protein